MRKKTAQITATVRWCWLHNSSYSIVWNAVYTCRRCEFTHSYIYFTDRTQSIWTVFCSPLVRAAIFLSHNRALAKGGRHCPVTATIITRAPVGIGHCSDCVAAHVPWHHSPYVCRAISCYALTSCPELSSIGIAPSQCFPWIHYKFRITFNA